MDHDLSRDTFTVLGALLSNLELLTDSNISPWYLRGLMKRGVTCNHGNIKHAIISYFKRASQEKEWEFVSHDLAITLLNAQKQSDNCKSIVSG